MPILQEVLKANEAYAQVLVPNPNWHCRPRGDLPSLPAWMHVSIPQNMLDFRKETHT